ncbi:CPBP family intramembrane glutamic endopeptidase [Methanobrevibacter sp.]|uniref:CPBP family intramembrane glutamic endopeptidase n=1 Tax=Methanobrevibacter sp. TaxID=66852 RepID=UPI003867FC5F
MKYCLKQVTGVNLNADKKFFSKIGFNYLTMGLIAIVFQIILVNILAYTNMDLLNDINFLAVLSSFCNYVIPLPIFIYLMGKLDSQEIKKERLGIQKLIIYVSVGFTITLFGNVFGIIITSIISQFIGNAVANPVHDLVNSTDILLNIILICLIGPIFEELIFRKLLIDRTIKYGAKASIIISAVLFAFFHGNLNQFCYTLLFGGLLAYVYIKTGQIIYPIILHIIANLMGSVVTLFFSASATAIISWSFSVTDIIIVTIYFIVTLLLFLIGCFKLIYCDKTEFLKKMPIPLKTIFLNYGMVCFILFFTFVIIQQIV